jgi:DnaJ like chaperone protein
MSIWGKIIGGAAGFAIGGPIGAIIGAVAGHHVVDKNREQQQVGYDNTTRQAAFTTAIIVLSAKMAKADGVVTRDEVDAFKTIFHIPQQDMAAVGKIFDEAKLSAEGYEPYAEQIGQMFRHEPQVLEELIGALFHIAKADGVVHANEMQFMHRVALLFGFSDRDFERLKAIYLGGGAGAGGGRATGPSSGPDPYEIIGVDPKASDDEVKNAYRKLVRENHPDALMAKGMPEEFIEVANEKLAAINDAYDRIKKTRGLT